MQTGLAIPAGNRRGLPRRAFLVAGATAATSLQWSAVARPRTFDALVGEGAYATVAAAISAAPANAGRPWRIGLKPGIYREKLIVEKPWIHLIGTEPGTNRIAFGAAAGLTDPDGKRWGTSRSATLTIAAPDCALSGLQIVNDFDYLDALRPGESPAGFNLQAVALALKGTADRTIVERCHIAGWQDTLLPDSGSSLFRDCDIAGSVDFIFGAGTAFFDRCRIMCMGRGREDREGYITAPSTPVDRTYGLVFDACRIMRSADVADGTFALGRPWRPGPNRDAVGQAVFLRSWMDAHIDGKGWDHMAYGRNADGMYKWFEPADARMFEYRNRGPGAAVTANRRQLTIQEARGFSIDRVLSGYRDWPT